VLAQQFQCRRPRQRLARPAGSHGQAAPLISEL
jgi:hypothetical protein